MKAHVVQNLESVPHAVDSITKMGKRLRCKLGVVFSHNACAITAKRIKHVSCFHDSLSRAKCIKASFECIFFIALARALCHYFHETHSAKSAFMYCVEPYLLDISASGKQCTRLL